MYRDCTELFPLPVEKLETGFLGTTFATNQVRAIRESPVHRNPVSCP
ncbi:hypothetical protein [Planktothricoides sp. SR001]|nr:hypothetical protein [Planktothricoides sp. SR001]